MGMLSLRFFVRSLFSYCFLSQMIGDMLGGGGVQVTSDIDMQIDVSVGDELSAFAVEQSSRISRRLWHGIKTLGFGLHARWSTCGRLDVSSHLPVPSNFFYPGYEYILRCNNHE